MKGAAITCRAFCLYALELEHGSFIDIEWEQMSFQFASPLRSCRWAYFDTDPQTAAGG
jgi:hypothetical protein